MSDQIIEIDEDGKVIVHMADCCRAAVLAENEACAKAVERLGDTFDISNAAQAIRARTAQEEGEGR